MCGIFGMIGRELPGDAGLRRALDRLTHRGPDQSGVYTDTEPAWKLWLGHRRLSILDLSKAGRQPFATPDGRVAVAVNGEIYNFRELRAELEARGAEFRSDSDSEVLLWGFYYEGESFFVKMRGMYAAAIWDRRAAEPRLLLLRDRMGIKPLYFCRRADAVFFASEMKALTAIPGIAEKRSDIALQHYLLLRYIPAPLSIFEKVFKVSPGQYVVFRDGRQENRFYWQIDVPKRKFSGTPEDAADELDRLLNDAVKEQLMADVPLGAFLSGGIDSSLICAIAQRQLGSGRLKTFTIGFETQTEDESRHAEKIAEFLGTEHVCERMTAQSMLDILPDLPEMYDEPFADDSALATRLLCRLARKEVVTALSGDGGDELFFGYNNLAAMRKAVRFYEWLPDAVRTRLGRLAAACGKGKIREIGELLAYPGVAELYVRFSCVFSQPFFEPLTGRAFPMRESIFQSAQALLAPQIPPRYMAPFFDMALYLPDDICCKVDRASMACSLEVRPPLLDHRIVEFANQLPFHYKYDPRQGGKLVLKKVLERYVPRKLWDRPKQGFSTPIGHWFRHELQDAANTRLAADAFCTEYGLHKDYIRKLLREHQDGAVDHAGRLWTLLVLDLFQKNRPIR